MFREQVFGDGICIQQSPIQAKIYLIPLSLLNIYNNNQVLYCFGKTNKYMLKKSSGKQKRFYKIDWKSQQYIFHYQNNSFSYASRGNVQSFWPLADCNICPEYLKEYFEYIIAQIDSILFILYLSQFDYNILTELLILFLKPYREYK
ncbi:hypothetical protein pb186bvf_006397 [Paramecium bursaria]